MAGLKSLAKDTVIYGLSSILGRFLNWCLVPLYTIMFLSQEYGIVTYLYSYVALVLVILTYGMETGFFRFANNDKYKNPLEVYSTSLISLATTSIAFILGIVLFIEPISSAIELAAHPDYILIMAITVAIDAFSSLPFSYLRYQNRAWRFATIRLISIGVNIGLNIFFILACPKLWEIAPDTISWFYDPTYGIGYIFVANLISTLVTLILLTPELLIKYSFNGELLKRMLRYSFPLLILGIAGVMNQTIDKILFPYLYHDSATALSELGIYGANYKVAIIMVMFIQAFRFAFEPFIFSQSKEGKGSKQSYIDAMKYFIIFSLLIFITVMYYMDIIKYFIAPSYFSGLKVVPIIMLAELFMGIVYNLSLWYKLTDQTQWGMYFSLIGLTITVGLNLLLVPIYGYMGCAWSAFSCYLVMMIISYIIGNRKFPINYDMRSALFYSVITAIFYFVGVLPEIESEILRLTYRTLLLFIYITLIIKKEKISPLTLLKIKRAK